jgi:hypothetical protein
MIVDKVKLLLISFINAGKVARGRFLAVPGLTGYRGNEDDTDIL